MKPLKVVFDTNVLISAILFGGNPLRCLEMGWEGEMVLITSKPILLELAEKMHKKFKWSEVDVEDLIEGISKFAEIIEPKHEVTIITKDEPDNRVLEAAVESKADYIISGDKRHILPLRKFGKTKIVTAAEFIKSLPRKN